MLPVASSGSAAAYLQSANESRVFGALQTLLKLRHQFRSISRNQSLRIQPKSGKNHPIGQLGFLHPRIASKRRRNSLALR